MDYLKLPFFDNHTHPLDEDKLRFTPDAFALAWLHGFRDQPDGTCSDDFMHHVRNQGCVHTMVARLSAFLGCPATLEAVAEARSRRVEAIGVKAYAASLYADAGIFCSLLDSDLPHGAPQLDLFPGKLLRHIQMDPIFFALLKEAPDYETLRARFIAQITRAVQEDGCVSIKGHVGELFTMKVRFVSPEEAQAALAAARAGDHDAQRTVYYAVFHQAMLTAQELRVPIHVHTGMTGGFWDGEIDDADPYRIAPFLRNVPHMRDTDLVFLHSNYPFMSSASLMAHTFPHVYVDLAWVLPWASLSFAQCLEDLLIMAPVSKILLGSGQHNIPEIAWLSSQVARRSLRFVADKLVGQEMLTRDQADDIARMLMYKNACRLYRVDEP